VSDLPSVSDTAVIDALRQAVPGVAVEPAASIDMPAIVVDREHLVEICRALRDLPSLQFAFLAEVTAADYLPAEPRFEVVYHLACLGAAFAQPGGAAPARRLRMKVRLTGGDARLPSVTSVYPTAGWPEREVFDLFGVVFEDHPDLRRILMTDDWEGHPLRKDYPVQIRRETSTWSALQLTPEEFAANIRAARDHAKTDARHQGPGA
jgi:NADH-quinone oxidoreductase subunit C